MTIYRVQDKDGRGPWKPGFSMKWAEDHDPQWYADHPTFYDQFGMGIFRKAIQGMECGTGCVSLEQLRGWFTPTEYAKLRGFGYQAVKMEVGRILAQSGIQVVFERAKPLNEGTEPVELYEQENPTKKEIPELTSDQSRD